QGTTPAELIAACTAAELPLLEISERVPFTAVSRAAAASYAADRHTTLVGMVQRGDALAAALAHGAGVTGVRDVLRGGHGLPLLVVARTGRLLAAAGAGLDDDRLRAVAAALTRRPPPLEVDLGAAGAAALYPVGAVGDADAALLCLRPVRT